MSGFPPSRNSQARAKLSFVRKFFPETKDIPEPNVGENPELEPKARTEISEPEIVLSTPKKEVATLKPETGSKRKREFLEERNYKKQKVSPSIGKKINFFEGKSKAHDTKLGTAQHARVGGSDLSGQSSAFKAGMAAGGGSESGK